MPRKKKIAGSAVEVYVPGQKVVTVRTNNARETGDGERDGKIWLSRIAKTERAREEMPNGSKDWERYYQWYEGEQWNDRGGYSTTLATDNARDTATVNVVGSIAGSYVPFLINGEIKFKLIARKQADATGVDIQEALLNYEWAEQGMTDECKRIVLDAVIIGHCVGKTGYVVEVDQAKAKADGEINYADYIKKDSAFLERVDPMLFLFDLSAKDGTLRTARWCAEAHFEMYNDVMSNENYNQAALDKIMSGEYKPFYRKGFNGTASKGYAANSSSSASSEMILVGVPEDDLLCLWEVWDKKYKKRYIYAEGVPMPLFEEAWPYEYLDGFPYYKMDYIRVPSKPYGMGVYRQVEDQQLQLNRIRTAQFRHIRSHQRKFIGVKGAMDPEDTKDFADLGDGALIMADRPDAIKAIEDAAMSPDFQIVEGNLQRDIQQLTGADALLQGAALPSRTTAGEVAARTNITRLKADDRVSAVVLMVKNLAGQVLQHLKKNRTLKDTLRIVGPEGTYWREYTNEEIQAETDVIVEYFSAPRFDPAVDRQQALEVMQIAVQAMPAMQAGGETVDMTALFKWALKKFDFDDAARFFKPLAVPDPPIEAGAPGPAAPAGNQGALAPSPVAAQPGPGENPGAGLEQPDLAQQFRATGVGA